MGMDQYIIAKHRITGETFPMMYWRKNYDLNQTICELADLNTESCFVETELTEDFITLLSEESTGHTWFFEYLDNHMYLNGDYDENHNYTPDYIYIYQADW